MLDKDLLAVVVTTDEVSQLQLFFLQIYSAPKDGTEQCRCFLICVLEVGPYLYVSLPFVGNIVLNSNLVVGKVHKFAFEIYRLLLQP